MPPATKRIREGIDPEWLAGAAEQEPVLHAYALWDLERAPESTRFVTYGAEGRRRSYLLIWLGDPSRPVVHWIGDDPEDHPLLGSIPHDVSVAVVPDRAVDPVRGLFPLVNVEPLLIMSRAPTSALSNGEETRAVRLNPSHSDELRRFADRFPEMLTRPYRNVDLAVEQVWGSFEGAELVGVSRVTVRLPRVWIVSGVYVAPHARGRGHGRALAGAATAAALHAGATAGLFVRERNVAAVRLYERLGYGPLARRFWIERAHARTPAMAGG